MKSTFFTTGLLACASVALAAPAAEPEASVAIEARSPHGWGGWWKPWRKQKEVFEFTSTYFVTATPDQVIATNQTAVPGQPGACGYYYFGINSYTDTICYVCCSP